MKSYTVSRPRLDHDGKRTLRGGTVQLSDTAAAPLVALGAVSPAPDDASGTDDAADPDADVTRQVTDQVPQLAAEIAAGGGVDAAATLASKPAKPPRATKGAKGAAK